MITGIEELIEEFRKGSMIILADDEDRENEGDIVVPAETVTPQMLAFMMKYVRGYICLAMDDEIATRFKLKRAKRTGEQTLSTAFCYPIDLANSTDGETAQGRYNTAKKLLDLTGSDKDLHSPGSLYPIIAKKGGVLTRAGHTEASTDLAKLSGMQGLAVICEIMLDNGEMARMNDLKTFAKQHDLKIGTVADLISFRLSNEKLISLKNLEQVDLPQGSFTIYRYQTPLLAKEQIALVLKGDTSAKPLVRIEASEDEHHNLEAMLKTKGGKLNGDSIVPLVLEKIAQRGHGALISLGSKGVHAKKTTGKIEVREHGIGSQILVSLGFQKTDLLVRSIIDPVALSGFGIDPGEQIKIL